MYVFNVVGSLMMGRMLLRRPPSLVTRGAKSFELRIAPIDPDHHGHRAEFCDGLTRTSQRTFPVECATISNINDSRHSISRLGFCLRWRRTEYSPGNVGGKYRRNDPAFDDGTDRVLASRCNLSSNGYNRPRSDL